VRVFYVHTSCLQAIINVIRKIIFGIKCITRLSRTSKPDFERENTSAAKIPRKQMYKIDNPREATKETSRTLFML
jgi:hypothetical protein